MGGALDEQNAEVETELGYAKGLKALKTARGKALQKNPESIAHFAHHRIQLDLHD